MRRGTRALCFGSVLAGGTLACGEDDGGGAAAACGTPACGGDLTGTWSVLAMCDLRSLTESASVQSCPGASLSAKGIRVAGEVAFDVSGAYSAALLMTGTMSVHYPAECLQSEGRQLSCAELDMGVQESLAEAPDATVESMTCTGSSSCTCVARMRPQELSGSGTYTAAGSDLTMIGPEGVVSDHQYCVDGSTLVIIAQPTGANSMSMVLSRRE